MNQKSDRDIKLLLRKIKNSPMEFDDLYRMQVDRHTPVYPNNYYHIKSSGGVFGWFCEKVCEFYKFFVLDDPGRTKVQNYLDVRFEPISPVAKYVKPKITGDISDWLNQDGPPPSSPNYTGPDPTVESVSHETKEIELFSIHKKMVLDIAPYPDEVVWSFGSAEIQLYRYEVVEEDKQIKLELKKMFQYLVFEEGLD